MFEPPNPPFEFDEADVLDLRFLPGLHIPVRFGAKSATSRRGKFGEVGTVWRIHHKSKGTCPNECLNARYVTTGILELPLSEVRDVFWDLEGAESPEDFEGVWNRCPGYPTYEKAKDDFVYFHRFRRVR